MRTHSLFVALGLTVVTSLSCTTSPDPGASPSGQVQVGSLDVELATAGCSETGGVRHAAGLYHDEAGGTVIVEAQIRPAAPDDGPRVAAAMVRSVVDGEVLERYVGDGLVVAVDDATYTLSGDLVAFDGATQAGDLAGSIVVTCPPSNDPGGGNLAVDGREVRFDLVSCLRTPVSYEARARSSGDADQALTLRRSRSDGGWIDQIDVAGEVVANERTPVIDDATTPQSVTSGAFEVRGARVTAEGDVLGPDRHTSISLTCGIDLVAGEG